MFLSTGKKWNLLVFLIHWKQNEDCELQVCGRPDVLPKQRLFPIPSKHRILPNNVECVIGKMNL